ncbi:MAG: hypothetical protein JO290_05115 [Sphingomonadaceae bacterium]|nr:hypothetical protein [Sphingomonadaceae bacterium]
MAWAEAVVLIILIMTIGRVVRARYGLDGRRGRRDLIAAPQDAVSIEDGARMKAEIDRLASRVQVLERLVTDPSRRLSDQIDALARVDDRSLSRSDDRSLSQGDDRPLARGGTRRVEDR